MGKLTAPRIEPSEIHLVTMTDSRNSANAMPNTRQSKNASMTAPTSTPLPPLKPKYSGNIWPRMTKMPAVSLPTGPASTMPIETAAAPLAMSPSSTSSVFFAPMVRYALVRPAFPLP